MGIIPYLGDIAKIGKLPKLLKIVENVVGMAKADAKFAKVVEPLLKGLKNALDKLPIHIFNLYQVARKCEKENMIQN